MVLGGFTWFFRIKFFSDIAKQWHCNVPCSFGFPAALASLLNLPASSISTKVSFDKAFVFAFGDCRRSFVLCNGNVSQSTSHSAATYWNYQGAAHWINFSTLEPRHWPVKREWRLEGNAWWFDAAFFSASHVRYNAISSNLYLHNWNGMIGAFESWICHPFVGNVWKPDVDGREHINNFYFFTQLFKKNCLAKIIVHFLHRFLWLTWFSENGFT